MLYKDVRDWWEQTVFLYKTGERERARKCTVRLSCDDLWDRSKRTRTRTYTRAYTHIHARIQTHMHMRIHTHMHARIHTHIHPHIRTMHTRIHACIHMQIHTHRLSYATVISEKHGAG